MKLNLYSLLWSLGTVVISGLVAYLVVNHHSAKDEAASNPGVGDASFHEWLHQNLKITSEQDRLLHSIEHDFENEEVICRKAIKEAGLELARIIRNEPENREKVAAARKRLHEAQGKLQEITLEHFFAMKQHLSPEQGEKLLEWTYDSLTHGNQR